MPSKENSGIINSNQYSLFSSDCIPHCQCRRTFFDFSTLWNIFRSPEMGWKSDLIWFSLSSTQYFSCRYNVHEILAFLWKKGLYSRQVVYPVRLSQFPLHKATRGMRHFIRLPWQFAGPFSFLGGHRHCENKRFCPRMVRSWTQTPWLGVQHTNLVYEVCYVPFFLLINSLNQWSVFIYFRDSGQVSVFLSKQGKKLLC